MVSSVDADAVVKVPAPVHYGAPWDLVDGRSLTQLLDVTVHKTRGGCRWRRGHCDRSDGDRLDAAAWLVAEEIMRLRCGRARAIFDAWSATATGQPLPAGTDPSLATPFVLPTFGAPPDGASVDHAQGHVAEIAWRMLIAEENAGHRSIVHLARPDTDVTSPGGDGFVVYRNRAQADLAFRLWEIKKRDGTGSVASSIGNAYTQLDANAERYLAKITGQSEVPGMAADMLDLLADLVPAWKRADPSAGAGVAVAANASHLPTKAFTTMHKRFPALVAAGGIEGCLVGLGSLREFALYVRTLLWSGLSAATT
jgi:hypothetical protein